MMKRIIFMAVVSVLFVGMMGSGSCGKQALSQIDDAQKAIEEAKLAEAPALAPKRFGSAEDKLASAIKDYDKYKFRFAEEKAAEAEGLAKEALAIALELKAKQAEEERKRKEEEMAKAKNPSSLYDSDLNSSFGSNDPRMTLKDIHFGLDSSTLSEDARQALEKNAQWLKEHPEARIEIEGHCDERGTDEYNQALGAKRAQAVREFLAQAGIEDSRMRTISYGESIPADPGHDETAWSKNRRAHFATIN